jgi:hypothetical protein
VSTSVARSDGTPASSKKPAAGCELDPGIELTACPGSVLTAAAVEVRQTRAGIPVLFGKYRGADGRNMPRDIWMLKVATEKTMASGRFRSFSVARAAHCLRPSMGHCGRQPLTQKLATSEARPDRSARSEYHWRAGLRNAAEGCWIEKAPYSRPPLVNRSQNGSGRSATVT